MASGCNNKTFASRITLDLSGKLSKYFFSLSNVVLSHMSNNIKKYMHQSTRYNANKFVSKLLSVA